MSGACSSTALLRKVVEEIDVAVFAFDEGGRLRLINRAGEVVLGRAAERAIGFTAAELGLTAFLAEDDVAHNPRILDAALPGLAETANLFVPFFTTKPNGTGIGLALAREIAESHGGALTLENRTDRTAAAPGSASPSAARPQKNRRPNPDVTPRDDAYRDVSSSRSRWKIPKNHTCVHLRHLRFHEGKPQITNEFF